jgi:hypothetical protein
LTSSILAWSAAVGMAGMDLQQIYLTEVAEVVQVAEQ